MYQSSKVSKPALLLDRLQSGLLVVSCQLFRTKNLLFALVLVISLLLCFYKLAKPEIVRWDEYTNFLVVSDTIEQESFPILRYEDSEINSRSKLTESGKGYFFEKPPLWYWLTILSVRIFGQNNFGIRFVSAISGFLLILSVFFVAKRICKSYWTGFFSTLAFLGTKHLFWPGHENVFSTHTIRSADLDSLQLLFFVISLWLLWEFENSDRKKYKFLVFCAIISGFGFLTKGPFSLLSFIIYSLFIIISSVIEKKVGWNLFKRFIFHSSIFIFSFLISILPWHLFMYFKFGSDFLNEYFLYHIFNRAFTTLEGHDGTVFMFWRYLFYPNLFVSGILLFAGIGGLIGNYGKKILCEFELFVLIFGTLFTLLLLTVIQTQIAWYLFYVYPFAFMVIGKFLADILEIMQRITRKGEGIRGYQVTGLSAKEVAKLQSCKVVNFFKLFDSRFWGYLILGFSLLILLLQVMGNVWGIWNIESNFVDIWL